MNEANIICRQIGYGPAIAASTEAEFGEGLGPILLDDLGCTADDDTLFTCPHAATHDCGHGEDAGVHCSDPTIGKVFDRLSICLSVVSLTIHCLKTIATNKVTNRWCNHNNKTTKMSELNKIIELYEL